MRQVPLLGSKQLRPIFLITLFDQISITIGYPILTFLCFDKSSTLFAPVTSDAIRSHWYGLLSSLPFIVAMFSVPLLSVLSDYIGRKKILIIGAFGALFFSFFSVFGILTGVMVLLITGCVINGLCTRTEPVALAVIADCCNEQNKAVNMGYLQLYISVGAFLGPLLGGFFATRFFFHELNFSLPYIIGIGFGLLAVMMTYISFQETNQFVLREKIQIKDSLRLLVNPNVLKISLVLILTQVSWRIYYQFVPPILKVVFHYSPTSVGIFIALIAFWLAIASAFGIRFLSRYLAQEKIVRFACYAMLGGLLLAIMASQLHSQLFIWISAIPVAMGDVIIYSLLSTFYSDVISERDQGKVMGLNYIIVALAWSATGLLGGLLAAIQINMPIIFAPLSLVLLFILFPALALSKSKSVLDHETA